MSLSIATILTRAVCRTKDNLKRLADSIDQLEKQAIASDISSKRQEEKIEAQLDIIYHRAAMDELRELARTGKYLAMRSQQSRQYAKPIADLANEMDVERLSNEEMIERVSKLERARLQDTPVTAEEAPRAMLSLSEALSIHALRSDIGGS